jgi:hypothetical protein
MNEKRRQIEERQKDFSRVNNRKKELEEIMDTARRKLDQINMGIVLENNAEHYKGQYFAALNEIRIIECKPTRNRADGP